MLAPAGDLIYRNILKFVNYLLIKPGYLYSNFLTIVNIVDGID